MPVSQPTLAGPVPVALTRLLHEHGAAHAPHYPPSDNSDHGPMAYLAMFGLGLDTDQIERFAIRYRRRLAPLSPPDCIVSLQELDSHLGRRESYSALIAFFASQIEADGWQATLARHLPPLISGWVKDAFHPIIRLSYGIEFEVPSEIAAGLAYLTITGDDPVLAALAQRVPETHDRDYFGAVRQQLDPAYTRGPFNARYRRIVSSAALRPAIGKSGQPFTEISRACLEVFHATHDFFALHLITGSHAFRICAPWAGPDLHALFSLGLGAAYLAIGAPTFAPIEDAVNTRPIEGLSHASDEHDIKLAYSCRAQSRAFGDNAYDWVGATYLTPRLASQH